MFLLRRLLARRRAVVLATALLLTALTAPVTPSLPIGAALAAEAPVAATAAAESGASRTFHVSTNGSDAAQGTAAAPLRTISEAVDRATSGDRILVHDGSYHESVLVPQGLDVAISAAPGAHPWLEGSRRVSGWRRSGGQFVHPGWRVEFDASPTYTWGAPDNDAPGWSFVNPRHPMAAHPDQVWIDGRAQQQVSSRRQVGPGRFFVDYDTHRLYLGSDPRGRTVRASDIAKALGVQGAGTSISGLGVRRFAPSVPHMGAVTVEAPGVHLDHMAVRDNATTGLHVTATDAVLNHVRLERNGMLGLSATYADHLRLLRVVSRRNNTEHFNQAPVAGGAKVGRTRGVEVRDSDFSDNDGTGLWFDESTYDLSVVRSAMRDNRGHGLSVEISAVARIVGDVVAGNHRDGIKVNDTSDVAIWNNTVVGNGRPLDIVQDDRDATGPATPGHDPRQPAPDPTMPWLDGPVQVHDNVLGRVRSSANCLLCVEDYSGRFSADDLHVTSSGNVYQRVRRDHPTWAVVWSRGYGDPYVFDSVDEFSRSTGQEQPHLELVGEPAVDLDLRVTPRVQDQASYVAEPLPAELATLVGRSSGERHLGAW